MKAFKNERTVDAPVGDVFHAVEDPAILANWWGPAGFMCTFHTFEFKPGGRWTLTMHGPDGAAFENENVFEEIVKPFKVVVRHVGAPFFTVTLTLEARDNRTAVTWVQDFEDEKVAESIRAIVEPANEQILDKLQAIVEGK